MKKCITAIILLALYFSGFFPLLRSVEVDAASSDVTKVVLEITNDLMVPVLTIANPQIEIGQEQIFILEPIILSNGQPGTGLVCQFTITLNNGEVIIIASQTDSQGQCIYTTSKTPGEQNFTVISGNVGNINSLIGIHSAVVEIEYSPSQKRESDRKTYTVIQNTNADIVIPIFNIIEERIYIGDPLNMEMSPATLSNGQVLQSTPLTLTIILPSGETIVLSGTTKIDGSFQYSSEKTLQEQGLTLVSGDIRLISNTVGVYRGYIDINYNNNSYRTNVDEYTVLSLPEIIRTGGILIFSSAILIGSLIATFTFLSRKNRKISIKTR